jgi:hypothetical protein
MPKSPVPSVPNTVEAELLVRYFPLPEGDVAEEPFRDSTSVGVGTYDKAAATLGRMVRYGWLEINRSGSRNRYRLAEAGRAPRAQAPAVLAAEQEAREAAWETEHHVYGVPRPTGAPPLTERQAREWVRGYLMSVVRQNTLAVPDTAPPEVKAAFDANVAYVLRLMAPHRPDFTRRY